MSEQQQTDEDDKDEELWSVRAVDSTTGLGKTRMFAEVMTSGRLRRRAAGRHGWAVELPYGYFGPTHRLNEDVGELWRPPGLTAAVYYGREAAKDKSKPDELMCLKPELLGLANEFGLPVAQSCCKGKDRHGNKWECEHHRPGPDQCPFQAQFNEFNVDHPPDCWVMAHQLLFHEQQRVGEVYGVNVDESFWKSGIWGIGADKWHLEIAEIGGREIPGGQAAQLLRRYRQNLMETLQQQTDDGGLISSSRCKLSTDGCGLAIKLEYKFMPEMISTASPM
jgi:hypothetical protein